MSGESSTMQGQVRQEVLKVTRGGWPREGRIRDVTAGGGVLVTVRSVTGDFQRLGPLAGARNHVDDDGMGGVTVRAPQAGDRCWVGLAIDTGEHFICAWDPA